MSDVQKTKQFSDNVKENFCGACLAVPIGLIGAGAAYSGTGSSKGKNKKYKQILLWTGITTIILSIITIIYFYFIRKCKTCK